ncbi:MAG: polyprenol monophosphomannose synthase [Anaerolineaceae bacterium]|nr:polyprenol monophosphomannose synthase [Anaerolineaceae bacterium]
MPSTIVILPTWNEAENLPPMVAALLALPVENLHVLVADDDSPDGTGRLADDLARQHPDQVSVLHRRQRRGYGPATLEGFRAALRMDADYIVQMDCDFSHQPRYLPDLLAMAADADVVIGSRYVPGGSVDENWGLPRKMLSWWANSIYVRLLLDLPVRDATGGFRLWRRSALESLGIDQVKSNGYVFQVEMICMAHQEGCRIAEIPIHFPDRVAGDSKMGLPIALEAALSVWQLRRRYRPSRH